MAIAQKTLHDHEEKTRIKEEERKKIIADLSHSIKNLISTAALKHSVGNMFDGKYFGTFMRKYIPEKSLYCSKIGMVIPWNQETGKTAPN
jgi:hypothetical protein